MKKALTIVLVAALVSLFGGTLWYLWRKSQKPVAIYDTEQPSVADIVKKTVATGSVIPRKEVAVKPQVSGIIEKILVEPGQDVRRGDLLATIRVVPNTAALAAAESRVHQAEFRSKHPVLVITMVFVVLEAAFWLGATVAIPGVLDRLGVIEVAVANLLAAVGVGLFLVSTHRGHLWAKRAT